MRRQDTGYRIQSTEHRAQITDSDQEENNLGSGFRVPGSETGITLLEVLVALTILAIGLLGVGLMQVTSIAGNTFSREMAVATELGYDMVERIKTFQWADTALVAGNHPTQDDVDAGLAPAIDNDGVLCNSTDNIVDERGLWDLTAPNITVGPLLYIRTWSVTDGPINLPVPLLPPNTKSIEVTVCWKEKGTTDRSVTIPVVIEAGL